MKSTNVLSGLCLALSLSMVATGQSISEKKALKTSQNVNGEKKQSTVKDIGQSLGLDKQCESEGQNCAEDTPEALEVLPIGSVMQKNTESGLDPLTAPCANGQQRTKTGKCKPMPRCAKQCTWNVNVPTNQQCWTFQLQNVVTGFYPDQTGVDKLPCAWVK